MRTDLLLAHMRSWFHAHHLSLEMIFGVLVLTVIVVALLIKIFRPPKV